MSSEGSLYMTVELAGADNDNKVSGPGEHHHVLVRPPVA